MSLLFFLLSLLASPTNTKTHEPHISIKTWQQAGDENAPRQYSKWAKEKTQTKEALSGIIVIHLRSVDQHSQWTPNRMEPIRPNYLTKIISPLWILLWFQCHIVWHFFPKAWKEQHPWPHFYFHPVGASRCSRNKQQFSTSQRYGLSSLRSPSIGDLKPLWRGNSDSSWLREMFLDNWWWCQDRLLRFSLFGWWCSQCCRGRECNRLVSCRRPALDPLLPRDWCGQHQCQMHPQFSQFPRTRYCPWLCRKCKLQQQRQRARVSSI